MALALVPPPDPCPTLDLIDRVRDALELDEGTVLADQLARNVAHLVEVVGIEGLEPLVEVMEVRARRTPPTLLAERYGLPG